MEFNIHIGDAYPQYVELFENFLLPSSYLNTVVKYMLLLK